MHKCQMTANSVRQSISAGQMRERQREREREMDVLSIEKKEKSLLAKERKLIWSLWNLRK